MEKLTNPIEDPEINAISAVYGALKDLNSDARSRVLNYVSSKFNITTPALANNFKEETFSTLTERSHEKASYADDDDFEGISPAGKKWITRSGINPSKLMSVFSLGIDEIDVVSKSVPGGKKSQRMRNVFLLKGLSAYLGTGAARFTHEQVKETCLHYDAWDGPNFSTIFKSMSPDVSGSKESGYTLTAKGISEATTLVRSMTGEEA
jgi:hypothetical protein